MGTVVEIESNEPDEKTPRGWQKFWDSEFDAAQKRCRTFKKQGNKVVARYLDARQSTSMDTMALPEAGGSGFALNFFHTNITTLKSMLYGSTPKVEVSREHQDPDDDVARVASNLYQRLLQSGIESSGEDLPTTLRSSLLDRLLPGIGTARVRYDVKENDGELDYEEAATDYVHWQDFLWGWGRNWAEIPWLGYRAYLDKADATARFGKKVADNLEYKEQSPTGDDSDNAIDPDQDSSILKAEVWEFWHKAEKKVFWYSKGTDYILDSVEDPLKLEGFWPSPMPMVANPTTTLFMPKADYLLSQDLYNEIDVLQSRIATITRAIKVVGVYDKSATTSVGRMLKEGVENDLIPVDNWAMFADKGGLQGSIQWFPVQEVVGVLATLQQLLSNTIDLLYQVTGMSDIMRGANTDQYTSDGTNQLKAKFGSIRVQALQDDFARFASDLEALKAEVISKHFSPNSIVKQSAAMFLPEPDKPLIGPALELMQSPDVRWRVDIRPESIAMLDYAQLKQEKTEYLGAVANYLQSATSMAKTVPQSLPILLEMLKWGMTGFKGSNYMEGILDQGIELAKNTPPEGEDGGKDKAMQMQQQMLQMQHQNDMEKIQAKSQADMQTFQAKMQGEMQKIQLDTQSNMAEQQQKAQADQQKIIADLRADLEIIQAKLDADLAREESQSSMAIAEETVQHDNQLIESAQEHQYTMDEIEESNEAPEENDDD